MTQPLDAPREVAGSAAAERRMRALPWLPLLLYAALSVGLWKPFRYIMYKDELSFVTIAERYAQGLWASAPNAFWPPLLSWLEALALRTGLPMEVAVKSLSLLIGVLAYVALQRLFAAIGVQRVMRSWFSLAAVPLLFYCAVFASGADLLLAALLTLYFSLVLRPVPDGQRALRWGIACGVLGALLYFCKGYALYFFVAHFAFVTVVNLRTSTTSRERRTVVTGAAVAMGTVAFLVAGWVGALHHKYGITTLGVIGPYNFMMRNPDLPGSADEPVPPLTYVGLVEPPATTTISVWEEPYYVYKMLKPWSPFDSRRALRHQLGLMRASVEATLAAFNEFTLFWLAIVSAIVLLWLGPAGTGERRVLGIVLVTTVLYPSGYWLLHTEERFMWPVWIMFISLAALLMQKLWTADWLRVKWSRWVIVPLVALSFVIHPVRELRQRANAANDIHALEELVAQEGLTNARIASNWDYGGSIILAYYVHAKYYGQPKTPANIPSVEQELLKNNIDYYLVWRGDTVESSILQKKKDLQVRARKLSIYTVRKPGAAN
jgi:hypothetical protein